ncbi:MAG TPA: hypothetical protein EYO59_04085, partial [Chromatiaceae bacterium]|nr:hypothetical protein [Chromatiaceae bacterium]
MAKRPKPIALIILDGWGYREDPDDNAILAASTPEWDRLWNECPHTLIHASGATVGLPGEQMGNSEVGHLNLGSGRVVYQEFTRVNRSIRTGSFFSNHTLLRAVKQAAETDKALHVFGLLSRGGVHSHEDHIHAMIKMALDNGVSKVYLHASLDGRDTPPKSAEESIALMEEKFIEYGGGCFASVVGRNSEVGHLNLGSGRVVYQEFTRVNRSIRTGSFFSNHTLLRAVKQAAETDKALHVFGLLSRGGVHSHEDHIHAMIKMALDNGVSKVYLHASLDGRDTPPKSAEESIALMEEKFIEYGGGRFASVVGRFYSMDRDHRWPRVEAAYDLITQGKGEYQSETALEALEASYARDETDEFVKASAIVPAGEAPVVMEDGDVV